MTGGPKKSERKLINGHVAELLTTYLLEHPDCGGIRGLAKIAGLSYNCVQKYTRGTSLPPTEKWCRLLKAMGLPQPPDTPVISSLFKQDEHNMVEDNNTSRTKMESRNQADSRTDQKSPNQLSLRGVATGQTNPEDRQEFYIPIHGFVWLYPEELEIVDHPAFQRLAGMNQLGLAHLVFRGATHRRFEHALGTVAIAQRMLEAVKHNCLKRGRKVDPKDQWVLAAEPTESEVRFTRLAALLHDIGHVPFGHTFEDELHLIGKHDKEPRLDKVLTKDVWHGFSDFQIETLGARIDRLYKKYLPKPLLDCRASDVLKRIVIHKATATITQDAEQHFAESGLRLAVCEDIVGNTICADLLDYLHRDWYHVGKPRYFDERLLHYMEVRTPRDNAGLSPSESPKPAAQDVFVICIGNRPKLRTDGISAILDLLENRYQLAEAVLFHRTKMSATSMLERSLSLSVRLASPQADAGASDADSSLENWLLDNAEERLLPALLEGTGLINSEKLNSTAKLSWMRARNLASRLLRRDLYDLLLMVTYDEFEPRDVDNIQKVYGDGSDAATKRASALRLLEDDFGIAHGSVTMYCPESRMNSKIAEVRIFLEGDVVRFSEHERARRRRSLSAGHLTAQLDRFESLWKIGFFIDPDIKRQKGEGFVAELRKAIRVLILGLYDREDSLQVATARIAREVVAMKCFHLHGRTPLAEPRPLLAAREDPSTIEELYPLGARNLRSFMSDDNSGQNQGLT